MILYLLRHGQAVSKGEGFGTDEERKLTSAGAATLRKVLTLASNSFGAEIDLILSSPYLRAVQSAEIAKEILQPKQSNIITDATLSPQSSPYELYSFVSRRSQTERILIVSHQPLIGEVLCDLIGSDASITLPPGSMARVDIATKNALKEVIQTGVATGIRARTGTLVWLISSDVVWNTLGSKDKNQARGRRIE